VSQLADRYVKDPSEVVKVQQRVSVTVLEVDVARKRIALSMRKNPAVGNAREPRTSPAAPRDEKRGPKDPGPRPPASAGSPGRGFNALAEAFRKKA
jgi:protein Tex